MPKASLFKHAARQILSWFVEHDTKTYMTKKGIEDQDDQENEVDADEYGVG